MRRFSPAWKHPFSGLSHLLGAFLSVVAMVVLLRAAQGSLWHSVSFAIYGATLVLLYTASGLYHLLRLSPDQERRLYALDRAAIYGLIAGTYTPICLLALPRVWGWSLLGVVWGLALVGTLVDVLVHQGTPDRLQALLYLLTGWGVLVPLAPLLFRESPGALWWLVAGCLIYTVGAIICVTNRPRLYPGRFDAHDLWHLFVMVASACHFVLMLRYLTP